jgi:hypothetical protein
MQEQQVDLIDTELAGALVERVQRGVIAVVADPQLRLHEDVAARDARAANALTDLALVRIRGRGIDQPVALPDRRLDGADRLRGRALEDAEAESGHLDAVVQRQGWRCRCDHLSPSTA